MIHEMIKQTLMQLSLENLKQLNMENDLRISEHELATFHQLLSTQWAELIEENSLSVRPDILSKKIVGCNSSKYHELITSIKLNVIFEKEIIKK